MHNIRYCEYFIRFNCLPRLCLVIGDFYLFHFLPAQGRTLGSCFSFFAASSRHITHHSNYSFPLTTYSRSCEASAVTVLFFHSFANLLILSLLNALLSFAHYCLFTHLRSCSRVRLALHVYYPLMIVVLNPACFNLSTRISHISDTLEWEKGVIRSVSQTNELRTMSTAGMATFPSYRNAVPAPRATAPHARSHGRDHTYIIQQPRT
jgi:hypothetical protein